MIEELLEEHLPGVEVWDAHDWARLPHVFQREIEREHVVLAEGETAG